LQFFVTTNTTLCNRSNQFTFTDVHMTLAGPSAASKTSVCYRCCSERVSASSSITRMQPNYCTNEITYPGSPLKAPNSSNLTAQQYLFTRVGTCAARTSFRFSCKVSQQSLTLRHL